MDGSKIFGVQDMTTISEIDEDGINKNLKLRYENDLIYTYTGSILVAVNPYKELAVFGYEFVMKYHGKKIGLLEPHIFAIAEAAYSNIADDKINQSCVISGESGAGKTETTKLILQYLCSVTCDVSTWVQQQILEANTILEAFGNAKTIRNDNSSRFGKFMQVCFDSKLCIRGCIIQDYLLEQSRITFQSPGERNYHVLYQLVAQGQSNQEMSRCFHLKPPDFYRYLNATGDIQIDILVEAKKFEALRMAFTVLQIPQPAIDGIIKVLSAILWLGNIDFVDIDGERCKLTNEDVEIISNVSKLLGLEIDNIMQVCLHRQINVRGNITEIPLKLPEARENRHAMAKALYSRTFAWLIRQINNCINPGQDGSRFLGVLDIFGFENFAVNSFEQLCINYTNEKLHKFFNHYVFALEQEIYKQEQITYTHIEFTDNTDCLELIEKPPRCILKLLTEQCHMPKGSDTAYLNNLHTEFESHVHFKKGSDRRHWETEFGIQHYAGCVIYAVEGFVDKNRDVQQDVLFDYMSRSVNTFIKELALFQDILSIQSQNNSTMQRGTAKAKLTVCDTFRQQLQALIDVLQNTNPWYVRCIKPNSNKTPNSYSDVMVLDQLKYLGMLDIIRIRREGFPVHFTFDDFVFKYKCLSKSDKNQSVKAEVEALMTYLNVKTNEWQVGRTKVFLRSRAYEPLEDARKNKVNTKTLIIQRSWRRYKELKNYTKIKNAVLKIQHAYRAWKLRIKFLRMRRSAIVIQSHLRGVFAREVAAALREMRRVDEEMKKRERVEADKLNDFQTEEENDNKNAIEACERLVQEEMVALSHMAEQINTKLHQDDNLHEINGNKIITVGESFQQNSDSVDLDNLFAFLSDVTPNSSSNHLLEEINENMDSLVQDLDEELENVLHKEMEELVLERPLMNVLNKGIPSLPEPTMPPPPPPPSLVGGHEGPVLQENLSSLTDNATKPHQRPEPIYEAVLPKDFSDITFKENNSINSSYNSKYWAPSEKQHVMESSKEQNELLTFDSLNTKTISPPSPKEKSITRIIGLQSTEREQRRKHRVEKKLQEMHQNDISEKHKEVLRDDMYYDILDFAENYFNAHERTPEGTIIATLTRKGKKSLDLVPKYEMITYYRGEKIPSSHVHMYDPENVILSCNIFRELSKYMRGEINSDRELQLIQYIIGLGIEREELRDEIFVQCMRQTTNNPHLDWTDRIWLLMCLTIVAFQPSKLLFRYYVSFLKKNLESLDGKLRQYAQWCFDNCKCTKVSPRMHPPSSVEVAAMRRLGTIVCRFFFLDGRTKAIDVHPTDSAGDAVVKLADKLNLSNTDGWAIYQSRPDGEQHVKSHDYLYDIIAAWEINQVKVQSGGTATRRFINNSTSGENRFVFKKRLFKSTRELSQDPVEVNMLYAQAVYSVVKCDDFPVSEKVALQLAGLQAQVSLGDPSNLPKPEYYTDVHNFLPERISKTREEQFWVPILAQAHRQYGASRNELTAKVLYLSCVMQYPLYGTTMFSVIYKGYWNHGNNLILGINCEGIILIQPDDKFVLYQYKYCDVESILLDPSDSFITITLNRMNQQQTQPQKHQTKSLNMAVEMQRCFVFETPQKNEIGALIVSYFPGLSNWIIDNQETSKKCKGITNEDRVRLYQNVVVCRRQLIDADIMRKPQDTSGGFLRNTLRRLSKHRLEKLRSESGTVVQDHGESYKGFSHCFWAFSRQQIPQSLTKLSDQEEAVMHQIFQAILTYSGLGTSGDLIQKAEDEHITIIQSIMERCMRKESLLNELYFQLIKQTTDHPDPNSRVNLKHWALLSLACSVILPPMKAIRKYLIGHLRRCASDFVTEEGKFARFAEKCFLRTQGTRRRQWPPSREEIVCTINRRPIYARFHFMDGQYHSVEFHPSSTAFEVMEIVKRKIGLNETAKGYAIFEVLGNSERSLLSEEKVSDVMSKWEKYRNAALQATQQSQASPSAQHCRRQHHIFLFKKHLFLDQFMNLDDPVEKELLYHQVLHSLRTERFPITEMEAIMLTALQGQLELGDCNDALHNYRLIASHCLPPRFVPNIPHDAVAMHHQSLRGMLPTEAKKSFLNLIQSWPLHRATIYDVMQSFTSNWPRVLWLAVDQNGIHLLEHRSRNTLCTYDFTSILSYSPNMNCLMIITGTEKKQSKVILTTSQAFQIANLIREYCQVTNEKSTEAVEPLSDSEETCNGA